MKAKFPLRLQACETWQSPVLWIGQCDGFGNSANLRQRLMRRKPRGMGRVLRLVRSPTEIRSPLVHACWREYNLRGKGEGMGTMAYGLVGPNSQATAQKHDGRPICLGVNALTRCDTEGAD